MPHVEVVSPSNGPRRPSPGMPTTSEDSLNQDGPPQTASRDLPQPLARLEKVLLTVGDDVREQHSIAFAVFEAAVRWLALLVLRARAAGGLPIDARPRVQAFLSRPSFGAWVEVLLRYGVKLPKQETTPQVSEILERVRSSLTAKCVAASRLREALRNPERPPPAKPPAGDWVKLLRVLPAYRNDFIGHTGHLPRDHFESFSPLFMEAAHELLGAIVAQGFVVRIAAPLTEHHEILQYTGESPSTVVESAPLPAGAEVSAPYIARADSDEALLSLGNLCAIDRDLLFLFDRSPRRGGVEYLDFASGDRTSLDGISLVKSPFADALSMDAATEAAAPAEYEGRREIRLQPLRRRPSVGELVPFRVVVWNHGHRDLELEATLVYEKNAWSLGDRSTARVTVAAGGVNRVLLWATAAIAGVFEAPRVELRDVAHADAEPDVATSPVSIRIDSRVGVGLVGREEIQTRLLDHVQGTAEHPGAFILVAGERGIGKTAQLEDLSLNVPTVGVRELRGYAQGGGRQPLKLFHDVLRDLLTVIDTEHSDDSLRSFAAESLAEYLGEESPTTNYFVSLLLGDDSEEVSEGMRHYRWFRLLAAAASESPIVLLLDDLHEADQESIALLRGILTRCRQDEVPLVAVITYRTEKHEDAEPEALQPLMEERELKRDPIALTGLERSDLETLLDQLYPGLTYRDDMPWIVDQVLERSGGNPAFILEMLRDLAVEGGADPIIEKTEADTWRLARVLTADELAGVLPMNISESLERRIDAVPESCLPVLEYASLLGAEYSVPVIERVIEDSDVLDESLDFLEAEGLQQPVDASLDAYRFVSSLLPETVVERLARKGQRGLRRRRGQLAEAMLEEYGESPRHAEWIGSLFAGAGREEEAFPHLVRALNSRARHGGMYAEALSLLNRHRDALTRVAGANDRECIELGLIEGRILLQVGQPAEAAAATTSARDAAERLGDAELAVEALNQLCFIAIFTDDMEKAERFVNEALDGARACGNLWLLTVARNRLGVIHRRRRRYEEARETFKEALEELGPDGDRVQRLGLTYNLGQAYAELGERQLAETSYEIAIGIAKELENLDYLTIATVAVCNLKYAEGELDTARQGYLDAIRVYQSLQNRRGLAQNYKNLSDVDRLLGRLDSARRALERSIAIRVEISDREGEAESRFELGSVLEWFGEPKRAATEYRKASELSEAVNDDVLSEMARIRLALLTALHEPGEDFGAQRHTDLDLSCWRLIKTLEDAARQRSSPSEGEIELSKSLLGELANEQLPELRCRLAAALAAATPGVEETLELVESLIGNAGWPFGAPLELLHRAWVLRAADEGTRATARTNAQIALETRAMRIEDAEMRSRFLAANTTEH